MHDRFLALIYSLAERRGPLVLAVMAGITIFFGLFIPGLRISSSHSELMPSEHPEQIRYLDFLDEFGAANNLIVVLEGEPDRVKTVAEFFAEEIKSEKEFVKSVFYKIDMRALMKCAPLFIPLESLKRSVAVITEPHALIEHIRRIHNLPSLLEYIKSGINNEISGLDIDPTAAPYVLHGMYEFFKEWHEWLRDPSHNRINVFATLSSAGIETISAMQSNGYLLSHDGRMLFLFVQPQSANDNITYLKPLHEVLRTACNRVFEKYPDLEGKIKVAFTGMPSHILTEVETIYTDVKKAGIISVVLVTGILLFGFASLKKTVIGIVPLSCGIVITLGLIECTIGRLTLVSSSFLAVLFGIGIDFGIYLIRRVEEERGNGASNEEAVRTAVMRSGKSIMAGGLTTGLAFLAITCTDFVGFSELGFSAGLGVLVVLATTFFMLPALLLMIPIRPRYYDVQRIVDASLKRTRRMTLYAVLFIAAGLCAFGMYTASKLTFDFNSLKLLPQDAESTVYQLKMQDQSDFQITCAAVTAGSMEELKRLTKRIQELPLVSRVDSLSEMIPDNQASKLQLISEYKPYLSDFSSQFIPDNKSVEDSIRILDELYSQFEEAQEAAFSAGRADIVWGIERNLSEINRINHYLRSENKETAVLRMKDFEEHLFDLMARMADVMHNWANVTPITERFFQPELLERFKSTKGNYVAYIFPKGSIWNIDFLNRFVDQLKEITPDVTGFPVTLRVNSRIAVTSLVQGLAYGLLIILILLAFEFRRAHAIMLVLIPLAVGMFWLQGVMYLTGQSYNHASIAGLPLLLGLGVVYGIHIVHRWMEHPGSTAFAAAATSGRGVAFAAFTTMASLVGVVFADHKGVSTFGIVILSGILLCLIATLYVLPALIDLLYLKKNKGGNHERKR